MKNWIYAFTFLIFLASCKNKNRETGPIVSVLSYLKGQALAVDSSASRLIKIETENGISDTTIIKKNQFRKYAEDFFNIPDISSKKNRKYYHETSDYDDVMQKVFTTYSAIEQDEEVRRETVISEPDANGETKINTILINKVKTDGDTFIEKDMTWHADKRFQIVTKTTREGQPEKVHVLMVKW